MENENFDMDLFENYDLLPQQAQDLLIEYGEIEFPDYPDTEKFLEKMNQVGYTFDYGLDNLPIELKKL